MPPTPFLLPLCTLKIQMHKTVYLLLGMTVLAACTEICDEPPIDDLNALYLEFKTEGEDGFSEAERESFYIVRYYQVPGDSLTWPADTIFYFGNFYEADNRFRISNGIPFENDSLFYVRYNYGLFFSADSTLSMTISDINLTGKYTGNCDYENQEKTFRLNGSLVDMGGTTDYYQITK